MSTKIKPDNDLFQIDGTQLQLGEAVITSTGTAIDLPFGSTIDGTGFISSVQGIDDLEDVEITTPATGEILKYNGTNWVNEVGSGGAVDSVNGQTGVVTLDLNDLDDVTITTPSNGQVLKYNGTAWINGTDNTGGGGGSYDQSLNTTDSVTFDSVTVTNTLTVDSVVNSSTGTPTISSGNDLNLEAAGEVTVNAPFVLKSYTVAQLSSVFASTGAVAYITNESGGAVPAFYDGTNWRRFTDRAIVS